MDGNFLGKYCVVRGDRSGVFAGVVTRYDGKILEMHNARCLWYWHGAASILQIALEGVKEVGACKFTVSVDSISILDAVEIVPCTNVAEQCIKNVPEWRYA